MAQDNSKNPKEMPQQTAKPVQQPSEAFDARSYLRDQYGYEVLGPGSKPGTMSVRAITPEAQAEVAAQRGGSATEITPNPIAAPDFSVPGRADTSAIDLDVNGLIQNDLKTEGLPAPKKLQFSTPENPFNENPLGFMDQLNMVRSPKIGEKIQYLKRIGAEDAQYDPETNSFTLKKDGNWYKADPGAAAVFAGAAPKVAGSILGGAVGAYYGKGRREAAIAGSVAGQMLAQSIDIASAESMGLRSESDFKDAFDEVTKDALNTLFWEVGGSLLGVAAAAGKQYLGKVTGELKQKLPQILEHLNGTSRGSTHTLINAYEEGPAAASAIRRDILADMQFEDLPNKDKLLAPSTYKMDKAAATIIDEATDKMYNDYNSINKIIKYSGVGSKKVPVNQFVNPIQNVLSEAGVVDDAGNLITTALRQDGTIAKSLSPNDTRVIKNILDTAESFAMRGAPKVNQYTGAAEQAGRQVGGVAVSDVNQMISNIDDALKASYSKPDHAIGTEATAILKQIRGNLDGVRVQAMTGSKAQLPAKVIEKLGLSSAKVGNEVIDLGAAYQAMNKNYAGVRNVLTDYGFKRFDKGNIGKTMMSEWQKEESVLAGNMVQVAKTLGSRGDDLVKNMHNASAANEFGGLYASKGESVGLNRFAAVSHPVKTAQRLVTAADSPRKSALRAAQITRWAQRWGTQPGLNNQTVSIANKMGTFVNELTGINKQFATELVRSPGTIKEVMENLFGASYQAHYDEMQTQQMLEQQAEQAARGQ